MLHVLMLAITDLIACSRAAFSCLGNEVKISFISYSTYLIESPGGVTIATDYHRGYLLPVTPTVVIMNRTRSTHFNLNPDPTIICAAWQERYAERKAEVS